jgi:hypothetical protein
MESNYILYLLGAVSLAWLILAFKFQRFVWFRAVFMLLFVNVTSIWLLSRAIELAIGGKAEDRHLHLVSLQAEPNRYHYLLALNLAVPVIGFIFGNYLVIKRIRGNTRRP